MTEDADDKASEDRRRQGTLKTMIATPIVWSFLVLGIPVWSAFILTASALALPFDPHRHCAHYLICAWGVFHVKLNPLWRVTVTGRENLPKSGACVLVSNHMSNLDVMVLMRLFYPFKWIGKKSAFKIPLVGWCMRMAGHVAIERGNRESVKQMLAECRSWLERGVPVFFFPEGTRSKDGELQPFKDGAFQLACESGCPIVPIALKGTELALKKHGFAVRPADITVQILPMIHPDECGRDVAATREKTRECIRSAVGSGATAPQT